MKYLNITFSLVATNIGDKHPYCVHILDKQVLFSYSQMKCMHVCTLPIFFIIDPSVLKFDMLIQNTIPQFFCSYELLQF